MITKEGKVKIADFGLARIYGLSTTLTSVVVTLWYRSPEVLLHSKYSYSVDMWSVGCIFAELFLKKPLFMGNSDVDQLYKIFEILGLPNESDWPESSVIPLKSFYNNTNFSQGSLNYLHKLIPNLNELGFNLLKRLLDYNINTRITAKDALIHPFFKQNLTENNENNNLYGAASLSSKTSNSNLNCAIGELVDSDRKVLNSLPDITNVFQPNILKRKRNLATNANSSKN